MRQLAYLYQDQNDLLKAREIYKEIINKYPQNDAISQVQQDLWQLNIDILFSGFITDNSIVYEVRPGDTLSKIARQHHTTVNLIKKNNDLKSDIIRPQDRLKVVTADFSILVDKSQNTLTLKASNDIIRTYSVSTGKDNHTPTGEFEIVNKLEDPVWYKAGAIVPADSPENILGSRWMGISQEGYGIHGTTDPETLGQQITAGCIRMSNKEVEELFTIVPRGTKVTIVD
jgi:lipoprotein-anchoring transpeptidase ErfK/SrfK